MTDNSIADACLGEAPSEDADPDRLCATCGDVVADSEWHPVATQIDETGEVIVYLFCSIACQMEWNASND